ncbi:amino acid--[acyl-carrier-protein] ligase [Paracraurococcus ruber]|uniref:Amino acid--[acyl-carrier-protein] ligase n=1 Tax=Paracraurococcus ruber TaxID=77675 RepID=A0ABS1CRD6_9PROT|nr:amino acid--[acyl-carrier-protein] ligase [Paracraurococcus ruber]MBK1656923.1 amino acid--[acyl-carrier-protein] ligase [Paracraurococcus ruber]TDG33286.1 amino acid--[acyl-carrier-protein] ligase [Paracraurococcus ruber]
MSAAVTLRPQDFRAELLARGLLIPTGVDGLYGRSETFEGLVAAVDALIGRLAAGDGAEIMRFPPVMTRQGFEASGYFRNFPQLSATIHCFCGDDREHRRVLSCTAEEGGWTAAQAPTDIVMTPASCYPVYPVVAARGRLPEDGWLVDSSSYCFRREPSVDPARMQMFRQREQVCFGSPEGIRAFQARWMQRAMDMFASLGLPAATDLANDPFFGRPGELMATGQRSQRLKFEILVPVSDPGRPSACGSFNYHVQHFAQAYGIQDAAGEVAHTGCAGFGLERIALALLRHHGFVPADWSAALRRVLWP